MTESSWTQKLAVSTALAAAAAASGQPGGCEPCHEDAYPVITTKSGAQMQTDEAGNFLSTNRAIPAVGGGTLLPLAIAGALALKRRRKENGGQER